MKGIKEVIIWMFENENKWLISESGEMMKYEDDEIWTSHKKIDIAGTSSIINLNQINQLNWEEVKTPYTFEEAYKLCKEEGGEFYNNAGDLLHRIECGEVYADGNCGAVLNCDWFRK